MTSAVDRRTSPPEEARRSWTVTTREYGRSGDSRRWIDPDTGCCMGSNVPVRKTASLWIADPADLDLDGVAKGESRPYQLAVPEDQILEVPIHASVEAPGQAGRDVHRDDGRLEQVPFREPCAFE